MQKDPLLEVSNLTKSFYLCERGVSVPSSRNVNLKVYQGCLTAVTGPTGCGKSTVLKCVYRTYLVSQGHIRYRTAEGETIDLATAKEDRIIELRCREISFVTQYLHFLPRKSTLDVVAKPLLDLGRAPDRARAAAAEVLARLDLPRHLWANSPATFSGGERQRVNLARSLVRRPRLLLLDEPTAGLDAASVERIGALIQEVKREGIAVLAVLHDRRLVETLADEEVRLEVPPPDASAPLARSVGRSSAG